MGFIPPLNLGNFQPSPATLSQWIYQIWQYLQDNPIATQEQIEEYIATFITTSPETQELIGDGVEQYLEDNPPESPVQSVQSKTGNVVLSYPDIVPASNAVPVYKAASTPSTSTLQGQYNNGYRLFVNTTTQEIYTISPAGALSKVGRGVFDGTSVDVNTSEGDTTIAEKFSEIESTQIRLVTLPCELPGEMTAGGTTGVNINTTNLPSGANVLFAVGGYAGSTSAIFVNIFGWTTTPRATIRNIGSTTITPTTPYVNVFYTI